MRKSRKRRQQAFRQEDEYSAKDPANDFLGINNRVILTIAIIVGVGTALYIGWTEFSDMDRNVP